MRHASRVEKWPTHISWVGKLFEPFSKRRPNSNSKTPGQGSLGKKDDVAIESSKTAPLAADMQLNPAPAQIMACQPPQQAESKKHHRLISKLRELWWVVLTLSIRMEDLLEVLLCKEGLQESI
jgi:hypothetical protein